MAVNNDWFCLFLLLVELLVSLNLPGLTLLALGRHGGVEHWERKTHT